MKRTQDAIAARVLEIQKSGADIFGAEQIDLGFYLDFEHAKPHLQDGVTEQEWIESQEKTRKKFLEESGLEMTPENELRSYMDFAWEKANGRRGLSANRSLFHMRAWLWLEGVPWADEVFDDYQFYGKPALVRICEHYGIDWRALDDDRWTNNEGDEGISADEALSLIQKRGE